MIQKRKIKNKRTAYLKYAFVLIVIFALTFISLYFFFNKKANYISPVPLSAKNVKSLQDFSIASIKQLLTKNNLQFISVSKTSDFTYLVVLSNKEEVLMSNKKDIGIQVTSLQLILNRLKIEGKTFSRLDLRFDKPVLVLK